jgi:hypothetical protein
MEMTPEQQITLNNYQAQYNSILQNIRSANAELEKSFKLAEEAEIRAENARS